MGFECGKVRRTSAGSAGEGTCLGRGTPTILTAEDAVKRVADECAFIDERRHFQKDCGDGKTYVDANHLALQPLAMRSASTQVNQIAI